MHTQSIEYIALAFVSVIMQSHTSLVFCHAHARAHTLVVCATKMRELESLVSESWRRIYPMKSKLSLAKFFKVRTLCWVTVQYTFYVRLWKHRVPGNVHSQSTLPRFQNENYHFMGWTFSAKLLDKLHIYPVNIAHSYPGPDQGRPSLRCACCACIWCT